jgi:uncharacterized protein (DUF1778 family)
MTATATKNSVTKPDTKLVRAGKTNVFNIRFEPNTLGIIQRAAKSAGLSVSAYLTVTAVEKAKRDLLDERFILLASDVFDELEKQIEQPAAPNPELTRLMRQKFEWLDE